MGGHEEREHRRFSPSQAERIMACPGSTVYLETVPARAPSPYAIEGTKAHEILDAALRNNERRAVVAHREHSIHLAEDFDDDFIYSVQSALNYIYSIIDELPDAQLHYEEFVNPPLPSAPGEGGGYCDVWIYIPSVRVLYVIDYKHGAGVAKDAKDNPQPLQYACGVLYADEPIIDPATVDKVVIVIIQPRAWHKDGTTREAELTPYEVYEYLEVLDNAVAAALKPNAPLVPGDDQCRFCDARTICPAREAMGFSKAVNETFKSVYDIRQIDIPNVRTMDIDRLSYIAKWAPFLRHFLADVERHIEELLAQGFAVPDWKLVEADARRSWYGDEKDVAVKLAALAGVPPADVMRTSLITITDAEKLVVEAFKARAGRGKKRQAAEDAKRAFAVLTLKQSTGAPKLVPADDPRQPINRAASAFGGIGGLLEPPSIET